MSTSLKRKLLAIATATTAGLLASGALAAHPRGNANYIDQHKPALTLWMRTDTRMTVFVCYKPNDHLNNVHRITVTADGAFSDNGPVADVHGKRSTLKISGRFVTHDEATGTWTAPCAKNHHFTAIYAPSSG